MNARLRWTGLGLAGLLVIGGALAYAVRRIQRSSRDPAPSAQPQQDPRVRLTVSTCDANPFIVERALLARLPPAAKGHVSIESGAHHVTLEVPESLRDTITSDLETGHLDLYWLDDVDALPPKQPGPDWIALRSAMTERRERVRSHSGVDLERRYFELSADRRGELEAVVARWHMRVLFSFVADRRALTLRTYLARDRIGLPSAENLTRVGALDGGKALELDFTEDADIGIRTGADAFRCGPSCGNDLAIVIDEVVVSVVPLASVRFRLIIPSEQLLDTRGSAAVRSPTVRSETQSTRKLGTLPARSKRRRSVRSPPRKPSTEPETRGDDGGNGLSVRGTVWHIRRDDSEALAPRHGRPLRRHVGVFAAGLQRRRPDCGRRGRRLCRRRP